MIVRFATGHFSCVIHNYLFTAFRSLSRYILPSTKKGGREGERERGKR